MKQRLREGVPIDVQNVYTRFTLDDVAFFSFREECTFAERRSPIPRESPSVERRRNEGAFVRRVREGFQHVLGNRSERTTTWKLWPLLESSGG